MSDVTARAGTLAVVILTRNEAVNLPQALASVDGWSDQVLVLDSCSTDGTQEIARRAGCVVHEHPFENYSTQRNYALEHLPITSEWVLFLDADEWLPPEIKSEISTLLAGAPQENGFYLNRRLIWMGTWIRRGYYPTWILRLFRFGAGRCEDRSVNEHIIVEGPAGRLGHDFIHEDRKGVTDWIAKHNRYATLEAAELTRSRAAVDSREIEGRLFGAQAERKRWLRHRIWNRMPLLLRPFVYFFYRYVLAGGFLDGTAAFAYHFLQGLWFPMLIDIKYLEMMRSRESAGLARPESSPAASTTRTRAS